LAETLTVVFAQILHSLVLSSQAESFYTFTNCGEWEQGVSDTSPHLEAIF